MKSKIDRRTAQEIFDEGLKAGIAFATQRFMSPLREILNFHELVGNAVECMQVDFKDLQDYEETK